MRKLCVPSHLRGSGGPSEMAALNLLRPVRHGEAHQVAAGQGEENHDDDEGGVVREEGRKVVAGLDVAQHQQRDERHPGDDQRREEAGLFTGLQAGGRGFNQSGMRFDQL